MSWIVLILSGALEAVWAAALHRSKGFRRPVPSLVFLVSVIASTGGLAFAMQTIPTGTAYAVWGGIGALGTVIVGIAWYQEPASLPRLLLILGVVACIAGLKITGAR